MKYQSELFSSAAIAALLTTSPAMAQQAEETGAEASSSPNLILVTARKTEESIQEVPISISAFSAEDIAKRSIRDLEDVALLTPGFAFEDFANGGYGTPTIRGATQFSIVSLEQNVSVFLDGIYIPRQYAFDLGAVNLERIEVVKGPQSALYGANAFAGAVNYITSKRDFSDLEVRGEVGVSENGGFDISAKMNAPLIDDMLSLRLAFGWSEFGGDWKNNHPDANAGVDPGNNGKIGGYEKLALSAGASFRPVDALQVDFDYYKFDTFTEGGAFYRLESSAGDMNCGANNGLYCGTVPNVPVPGASGVEGIVKDPRTFGLDLESEIYRAGAKLSITDALTLDYQFGRIEGDVFSAGHFDKDPLVPTFGIYNLFVFGPVGDFQYESHEARLSYEGDNGFYAMIGGFIQDGRDYDLFAFGFVPFRGLEPFPSLPENAPDGSTLVPFQAPAETLTDLNAVFGRVAVPLLDERLTLSAEARYTEEDKTLTEAIGSFDFKDSYFTPRFSADFSITPDHLVYASVAKGVKSGGVNNSTFAGLIPEERFYGPDTNWTYEIGSKNTFANGLGQLNVAIFYIDWGNLQVPSTPTGAPPNTASIVRNLGGAKSKGVEIDGRYEVTSNLSLSGTLAYIDATFNKGVIDAGVALAGVCDDVVCNSDGDIGGNEIQRSPNWQWSIEADYETPLSNQFDFVAGLQVFGQSKMFTDSTNTGLIEDRTLVNARLGLKADRWSASVWAKNLLDERYIANSFFTAAPFGTSYVPTLGSRRRIGVTLGFDF